MLPAPPTMRPGPTHARAHTPHSPPPCSDGHQPPTSTHCHTPPPPPKKNHTSTSDHQMSRRFLIHPRDVCHNHPPPPSPDHPPDQYQFPCLQCTCVHHQTQNVHATLPHLFAATCTHTSTPVTNHHRHHGTIAATTTATNCSPPGLANARLTRWPRGHHRLAAAAASSRSDHGNRLVAMLKLVT